MKKLLSAIVVLSLVLAFSGCASNPSSTDSTNNIPTTTEATEPASVPSLADYALTGIANVTDVYFSGKTEDGAYCEVGYHGVETATAVTVDLMCPYCGEETFAIIDFSDIPENLIGQQTFTWSDEEYCINQFDHSDMLTSYFNYSIMFTLNG